jgi:hypothetical protein
VSKVGVRAAVVALMAAGLLAASPPDAADADTKRAATVELRNGQLGVFGVVNFDVAGGAVNGAIRVLSVPYASSALLKLADGRMVSATLSANMTMTGKHGGGPLTMMEGIILLNGRITRSDDGCSAAATGQGSWLGRVDALLGMLVIDAYWPALAYQGCGAAPRDEFRLMLPRMRFAPLLASPPPA